MRILMTNHSLRDIGGTETWTLTMAEELVRRGHDVTAFCFIRGKMADRMPCRVTTEPPEGAFDLSVVNHNMCLGLIHSRVTGPKVFTSHGPAHPLEAAVNGADYYVAVSEEVRAANGIRGIHCDICRQPLNLDRFQPGKKDGGILVACKNAEAMAIAREACKRNGVEPEVMHYQLAPVMEPWRVLARHRVVITSGRGVYEALACGCQPLIFDMRSGIVRADGWVTEDNIRDLVQFNCSGRANDYRWGEDELADALSRIPEMDSWGIWWARENHDVRSIAEKYLAYAAKTKESET